MFSSKFFQSVLFRMIVLILPLKAVSKGNTCSPRLQCWYPFLFNWASGRDKRGCNNSGHIDFFLFIDDFSRKGIYPLIVFGKIVDVFINTLADSPPTIGVWLPLTGLILLANLTTAPAARKALLIIFTSRPIDLHITGPIHLLFGWAFYQPGLDIPETTTLFVVQFKTKQNDWINMWSVPRRSDTTLSTCQYPGKRYNFSIQRISNSDFIISPLWMATEIIEYWLCDFWINKQHRMILFVIMHWLPLILLFVLEFTSMPYTHYKALSSPLAAMQTVVNDKHTILTVDNIHSPGIKIYNENRHRNLFIWYREHQFSFFQFLYRLRSATE